MRGFSLLLVLLAGLALGQTAQVRVAHLSPDGPEVDVWINRARVEALTRLPFKAVSPYQSLPAGEIKVWVVPTGRMEPRVIEARVRLEAGRFYTVAAVGPLAQIRPAVILDGAVPPAQGQVGLRVLHAVPNFPGLDIRIRDGIGPLLFQNLTFPNASDYRFLDAGAYALAIFAAGDTTRGIPIPEVRLEAGKSYTVIVAGQYTPRAPDSGLSFLLIEDK